MSNKTRKQTIRFPLSVKYGVSYLVVLALVLVLLNTYPLVASQDLLFASKRVAMNSQTAVMASTLMGLEELTEENVLQVMNVLDHKDLERVVVTDPAGKIIYDSDRNGRVLANDRTEEPTKEEYALLREVVSALEGNDVFHCFYSNSAFVSTAAVPIVYRGMTIGAIYVVEIDRVQGKLLQNLRDNLMHISIVITVVVLGIGTVLSQMLTVRVAALLKAIHIVGEGEYGHRLLSDSHDELSQIAEEFNNLTDRLQATEEVRRRFVSDASHEMKTPLASIRLLADSILHNEPMEPELTREFVTDIGDEADRLTRITEHLLTLSRLENLPSVERTPVDVGGVVNRVVAMLTPVADSAGVKLHWRFKADHVIRCTEDDLYRVCFNLIENAIKYNKPGGSVDVILSRDDEQILLEVLDTGVGIPEEDLPKIFNRFYRVDTARSRVAGGTGLGLAIVRETVRRHGGWVSAERRASGGSSFNVGFPAYVPEEEEVWP